MKVKASLVFVICILALMLFFIRETLTFPKPEAAVMPMILLSGVVVLGLVQLVKELRGREKPKPPEDKAEEGEENIEWKWRQLAPPLAWVVALLVLIYLLGFFIALPIFFVAYLKWRGRSWIKAVLFAAVSTGLCYLFFQAILSANLWVGLFFR